MGRIKYSIISWITYCIVYDLVFLFAKSGASPSLPSSVHLYRSLRGSSLAESSIENNQHPIIYDKNSTRRAEVIKHRLGNTTKIREQRHLDDSGEGCDRYLQTRLDDTIGSYGQMFNIRPKQNRITITGYEFYTDLTEQWGNLNYFLFSREGTYQTAQNDLTEWSLVANGTITGMGKGNPTPIPKTLDLDVFPGGVRAFYFTLTRADLRYRYGGGDKGDEEIQKANNDLEIYEGIGVLSFPLGRDFSESSREFLGGIQYRSFLPCDGNDPDPVDPTILTTVVSLTFFIEHSNRLNLLSLVTEINQNVDSSLQNLLSSSAGLGSYADLYSLQIDKVESFLLQADENAPPCITTESASTCSVVEAIVTCKHNDEIDTDIIKKVLMDQGEPLASNMNYKSRYIGLSFLDKTKILELVGTKGTMNNNEISIFESQMTVFLKPFLENDGILIRKVVVKDQTFLPNSKLRAANIFAPESRRRYLQNEYGRNTVTFLVIAEYNAPPKKVMSGIVDDAIESSGEYFILAARGKDGGEYFNDVYLNNPIVDLEESDDSKEDDDDNNNDDGSNTNDGDGGSGSSPVAAIVGSLVCVGVVAAGAYCYCLNRERPLKERYIEKVRSFRYNKKDSPSDNEKRKSEEERKRSRRRSSRHRRNNDPDDEYDNDRSDRARRRRSRRTSGRRGSQKKDGSDSENEDKKHSSRRRRSSTKTESSGDKDKGKRRKSRRDDSSRSRSRSPNKVPAGDDSQDKFSQDESKRKERNTGTKRRDASPDKSESSHNTTSPESTSGRTGEDESDKKPNTNESAEEEQTSSYHRSTALVNNSSHHALLEESSSDEDNDDKRFDAPPEPDISENAVGLTATRKVVDSDKPMKSETDRGPIRDRFKEEDPDRRRSSTSRPDRAVQSEHRRSSKWSSSEHRRSSKYDSSEHRRRAQTSGRSHGVQSEHRRRSNVSALDDEKKDSENSEVEENKNDFTSSRHRRSQPSSAALRRSSSARVASSDHVRRSSSNQNDRMFKSEHRRTRKMEMNEVKHETFDEEVSDRVESKATPKAEDADGGLSSEHSDVDEDKKREEKEDKAGSPSKADSSRSQPQSGTAAVEGSDEKGNEEESDRQEGVGEKGEDSSSRHRDSESRRRGVEDSSSSRRQRGTSRSRQPESDRRRSSRGASRQRRASSSRPTDNGESDMEGGPDGKERVARRSSRGVSRQRRTSRTVENGESDVEGDGKERVARRSSRGVSRQRRTSRIVENGESDVEGDGKERVARRSSRVVSRQHRTSTSATGTRKNGGESDIEGGNRDRERRGEAHRKSQANGTSDPGASRRRRATRRASETGGGVDETSSRGTNDGSKSSGQQRNRTKRTSTSSTGQNASSERIQAHRRRKRELEERRRRQQQQNDNY